MIKTAKQPEGVTGGSVGGETSSSPSLPSVKPAPGLGDTKNKFFGGSVDIGFEDECKSVGGAGSVTPMKPFIVKSACGCD